ncbi:MAG TPA: DUF5678 domain-containing protein [Clostridia bacterium]|nr:DUF5678 domain-containing protein [Clostridia bacterium]
MENQKLSLEKEFQYYIKNLDELIKKYEDKYIVIKNGQVLNAYETIDDAIIETKKTEELGTFLVQKCQANEESYTQSYHSRVHFVH